MRNTINIVTALAIFLVLSNSAVFADSPRPVDRSPVGAPQHLVRLEVDPTTSIIRVLPSFSRDVINSSFTMVSANCTNCGPPCPGFLRSVAVVLEATADVPAGFGVSNLTTTNYTATNVQYSTQGPLTAGQQVTITITGDVLLCGPTFKLYFSMCDSEPADPSAECPPTQTVTPATCDELLTDMPVWGYAATGIDLRARTNSTLHWIGCPGNGCPAATFYCDYDQVNETLSFGTTDGSALRSLVDPGDALGDAIPTSESGCSGPGDEYSISNAPDANCNGSGVDCIQALCTALGYQNATLVRQVNNNTCPEPHSLNAEGSDWTSDYVTSSGFGAEYQCQGFLP